MSDAEPPGPAVLDILVEVLGESADDLRGNPVLATYDWNSITSLLALAQLESRFDVTLDLRALHAARTVDDLVGLVADATGSNATTAPH